MKREELVKRIEQGEDLSRIENELDYLDNLELQSDKLGKRPHWFNPWSFFVPLVKKIAGL